MLRLFREAGMPRRAPPALPANCNNTLQNNADNPQITSLLKGVTYTIRLSHQNLKTPETIALRANRDGQGAIYWFADNGYIDKSETGNAVAWTPQKAGHYVLRAVDDAGRADSREVNVEFVP